MKRTVKLMLFAILLVSFLSINNTFAVFSDTFAVFSDTERSVGNTITASTPSPDNGQADSLDVDITNNGYLFMGHGYEILYGITLKNTGTQPITIDNIRVNLNGGKTKRIWIKGDNIVFDGKWTYPILFLVEGSTGEDVYVDCKLYPGDFVNLNVRFFGGDVSKYRPFTIDFILGDSTKSIMVNPTITYQYPFPM